MWIAVFVVLLAMCAGVAGLHIRFRHAIGLLEESFASAIGDEVRRQDERIRKRLERSDGHEPDIVQTQEPRTLRPGDPWPPGG